MQAELIFKSLLSTEEICLEPLQGSSAEFVDLISKLLRKNPQERLGSEGFEQVKQHCFFHGVNWDNLMSKEPSVHEKCDEVIGPKGLARLTA